MSFSLFGTTFGLSLPAALLAIPLGLAALVVAYRSRGRLSPVPVASVLLLRLLESKKPARQSFFPPMRFFVELLALLLLAMAAARLFEKGGAKHIAIIIDDSFSTSAVDPLDSSGDSVFDQIKLEARQYLAGLSESSSLDIYFSSQVGAAEFKDLPPALAIDQIAGRDFEFVTDAIESTLGRIAKDPSYQGILVLTDKPVGLFNSAKHDQRVRIIQRALPANSRNNISLTNLRFSAEKTGASTNQLQVTVRSQSSLPFSGSIALSLLKPGQLEIERTSLKIPFDLAAAATESFEFNSIPEAEAYQVTIIPPPNSRDAISADNSAAISLEKRLEKVVLVTPSKVSKLGVKNISVVDFIEMHPSDLNDQVYSNPKFIGIPFIFHATLPAKLPPVNAIFVDPPDGQGIFSVLKPVSKEIQVSSWAQQHPITSYLNLPALKLSELSPLMTPAWAQPIIVTPSGVAGFAGEVDDHKYAAIGFSVFPFQGRDSPLFSVLTLNLLKWIAPFNSTSGYQFAPYALKEKSMLRRVDADSVDSEAAEHSSIVQKPGIYRIKGSIKDSVVAVNFFSDSESDLLGSKSVPYPERFQGELRAAVEEDSFRDTLIKIVLLLLLVEMLVSSRFIGARRVWKAA